MLIFENIFLALSGLKSNKMRTFLTMLGIIIGIASVIAIMTVGNSLSTSIETNMQSMGANNVTVGLKQKSQSEETNDKGMRFGPGFAKQISDEDYITDKMIAEYKENYASDIKSISLSDSIGQATVKKGSDYANVNVTGENEGSLAEKDLNILYGRLISEEDQQKGEKVALVSDKLVESVFDNDVQKALFQKVEVSVNGKYYYYTIVGIYEYEESAVNFSSSSDEDVTTDFYIPLITAQNQTHDSGYLSLTVVTALGTDTDSFMTETQNFFNRYYQKNDSVQISVQSMGSMLSSMTEMMNTVSVAISIIAGISLLVGGIGVMNIMLVSITERTREIGTRKALGATNGSIRLQFIMESVVICLIGGFVGIVFGLTLGSVAADMLGYTAKASVGSIVFSVVFSALIGIFFGYYPANKAARMNPIDALRYE